MPYKLTDDENYLLDKLDEAGKSKDAQALEAALKMIPDENGRKYLISKVLNSSEDLARLNGTDAFKNVNKDFWKVSNQENYTPPDVSKAKEEGFYDEESPYHWTKRSPSELKQLAEKYGYETTDNLNENDTVEQTPFHAFMNDVANEQTKQNREGMFKGVGGTALELLYPRMSEAVKRGDDIDVADVVGDEAEQFLYALNPVGRSVESGLALATKNGGKLARGAGEIGSVIANNASNPFIMEMFDAAANGGRNTPRANFNIADALMGTGINMGMGELSKRLLRRMASGEAKINPRDFRERETLQSMENKWKQQDIARKIEDNNKEIANMQNELDKRWAQGFKTDDLYSMLWDLRQENNKLESLLQPAETKTELVRNKNLKQLLPYDFLDFVSNKTGDAVSENPQYTKKVLRGAARGLPLAGPAISNLADLYYDSKKKDSRRKELDELLGSQR